MFFFKFLSQKLNLLYLEYFTDLQMQKTFEKHFQTIYYKFTTKLKKFIFWDNFTINVLQNGKLILKENQSFELKNRISA